MSRFGSKGRQQSVREKINAEEGSKEGEKEGRKAMPSKVYLTVSSCFLRWCGLLHVPSRLKFAMWCECRKRTQASDMVEIGHEQNFLLQQGQMPANDDVFFRVALR